MAKTTKSRAAQKGSPGRKNAGAKPPAKAEKKSPAKAPKAVKAKAPGKAPARRAPAKATMAEPSAMPRKAVSPAARRRARAPPQHQPGSKAEAVAEHQHQDPRLSGVAGTHAESNKVQTFNYGQFKNKAVARLDKPVNWFRRAPRPKQ
jgi:hypothetical protein